MPVSEHPWHGLSPHPWDDPLGPYDPLNPRPDRELAELGETGPKPEEFPFNWMGKRDYYAAVVSEAQRRAQIRHMQHMQRLREEEEEAIRRAALLLLS
jgi:hypothetical protein